MRILITSGGTKVAIDPVRHIANMSTGRFGSELAKAALLQGAEVIYLTAEEGRSPFAVSVNFYENVDKDIVNQYHEFAEQYRDKYSEYRYQNFTEYAQKLEELIAKYQPDIVVLAAAVSDYLVAEYANDKVRSADHLSIALIPAPKIINKVKQWNPDLFLVGFKLLVDADQAILVAAAHKVLANSQADMVVANNLASIQKGAHEVLLVMADENPICIQNDVAALVIQQILKRASLCKT